MFVKDGERMWFVRLGDVRLFESEGNYTRLYLEGAKPLVYRSLSYLEERVPSLPGTADWANYLVGSTDRWWWGGQAIVEARLAHDVLEPSYLESGADSPSAPRPIHAPMGHEEPSA